MDENRESPWTGGYEPPKPQPKCELPAGRKELIFAGCILLASLLLCNSAGFGGFNLGFGIGAGLVTLCSSLYLIGCGHRLTPYSGLLLGINIVIATGFARSDDGFVKFVMVCFLILGGNLGLTVLAGKNRRNLGGFSTLGDVFYTFFVHSLRLDRAFLGLRTAFRKSGTAAQKGGAIITGILVAVPVLIIMVFLLMRADAAFEGLMDLLPDFQFGEFVFTAVFGAMLFCALYTRGVSLEHHAQAPSQTVQRKGINSLTVNTVLIAVCLVYLVYLFSQIAYFAGGFAGILPTGYTMAEYARRGFFEMAWLCAINLGIVALSVGVVEKKKAVPLATKLLCLFISCITVFLVTTASGKMFFYISTYGLTRLRVLTQVIMLFLCLTTVLVAVWLFVPKMPYMKAVILSAMIIGAAVFWADVDTVVARHNVNAYLSGKLETVDVAHLGELNSAAIPYIGELEEKATDPMVRQEAADLLNYWYIDRPDDFRGWNYPSHIAADYIEEADN